MDAALLLKVKRGNITEREHYGYISMVDIKGKETYKTGNTSRKFFLRSCAKPFQAATIISSGAFKDFNISADELAVCCSSHTGTKEHTDRVKSILKKANLSEKKLKCGAHMPIDEQTQIHMFKNNLEAEPVHNNCSGKHAGMLAVCAKKGFDTDNYLENEHPLQKEIISIVEEMCEEKTDDIEPDGCGTPVPAISLTNMCKGFSKLMQTYESIKNAMALNPILSGGQNRIDTVVMQASKGKLVSKLGAEGLCLVFNTQTLETAGIKILDSNIYARAICVIETLKQLKWLDENELENEGIKKLFNREVKTHSGKLIGEIEIVFNIQKQECV